MGDVHVLGEDNPLYDNPAENRGSPGYRWAFQEARREMRGIVRLAIAVMVLVSVAFGAQRSAQEKEIWSLEDSYWQYVKSNDLERYANLARFQKAPGKGSTISSEKGSTISSWKGKYYSSNLSIPQPKFLVSRNLRLEGKVLAFGGACPGRVTQTVSAQLQPSRIESPT